MHAILILLLSIVPHDSVLRDEVDLVELNHFYGESGSLVFTQVIFYDWCQNIVIPASPECRNQCDEIVAPARPEWRGSRHQVVAWRMVKSPNILPQRDWQRGGWTCFWQDGVVFRDVHAKSTRETWTTRDFEVVERTFLDPDKRRGLQQPRIKPKLETQDDG